MGEIERVMIFAPCWSGGSLPDLIAEKAGIPVKYVIPTLVVLAEYCLVGSGKHKRREAVGLSRAKWFPIALRELYQNRIEALKNQFRQWCQNRTGTSRNLVPEPEPNTGTYSGNGTGTKERARAILAESPGISGSGLGRQLGLSERMGRKLKAELV